MTLLISIGEGNKITKVELVHSTEGIAIPTGTYAYNVDNEALCNAILNNYDKCTVTLNAARTEIQDIGYASASDNYHGRKIAAGDWIKRVRPALFRAATTTNLFNN